MRYQLPEKLKNASVEEIQQAVWAIRHGIDPETGDRIPLKQLRLFKVANLILGQLHRDHIPIPTAPAERYELLSQYGFLPGQTETNILNKTLLQESKAPATKAKTKRTAKNS